MQLDENIPHSLYFKAACVSSLISVLVVQFFIKLGFWNMDYLTRGGLWASGIVYSFLGISAIIYPEMRVGFIVVPFVLYPLKYVFLCVLDFDTAGLAVRWSMFDHAALIYTPRCQGKGSRLPDRNLYCKASRIAYMEGFPIFIVRFTMYI